MRNGRSNTAGIGPSRSRDGDTPISVFQKELEEKAREKLRRPLPARMPLCVSLSTGEFERMALQFRQQAGLVDPSDGRCAALGSEQKPWWRGLLGGGVGGAGRNATMTFVDDEWDGSVADAFARARIGTQAGNRDQRIVVKRVSSMHPVEQMGIKNILAVGEQGERERRYSEAREGESPPSRVHRVLVGSVRGQAAKSGIMKGDVVTHVNGEVFTGDAAGLNELLARAYEEQGKGGVVMIVVNAEECTAEALRLRSHV